MTILFSHDSPEAYPQNYHVVNDVMRTSRLFKTNRGCEVGVRHAFFSYFLMEHNQWLSMWCVDSYPEYLDVTEYFTADMQAEVKETAAKRLSVFGDRAHWMYTDSVNAARQIERGFFDFVFIDANHEYRYVKEDLYAWEPCVRRGGLLCGHDFMMEGVNRAVTAFAAERGYEIKNVLGSADVWLMEMPL